VGTSAASELWRTIAADAIAESRLWGDLLRPESEREHEPVFSPLAEDRFALGLETIYEGYLVHYGTSRLFAPVDEDAALLLGDYLYAHGLVRIAACGEVDAVADLAELISLSSQLRAEGTDGDGSLWAATAALRACSTKPRVPPPGRQPSTVRSPRTTAACGRFPPMLHVLAATAAEEGKKTVLMMLAVGGVFLAVITIGELTHWLRHRR
jgi:hypothetical protein